MNYLFEQNTLQIKYHMYTPEQRTASAELAKACDNIFGVQFSYIVPSFPPEIIDSEFHHFKDHLNDIEMFFQISSSLIMMFHTNFDYTNTSQLYKKAIYDHEELFIGNEFKVMDIIGEVINSNGYFYAETLLEKSIYNTWLLFIVEEFGTWLEMLALFNAPCHIDSLFEYAKEVITTYLQRKNMLYTLGIEVLQLNEDSLADKLNTRLDALESRNVKTMVNI